MTTTSSTPTRRAARAVVAAGITGTLAVAGVASASAASAATDTSGARAVDPEVKTGLDRLTPPFPGGSCIACGLGGFDPTLDTLDGGL